MSSDDVPEVGQGRVKVCRAEMAMKFVARRLRTVGAEAGTGRYRSFRLPTLRFEIQHRPTCSMDRAGQILLINLYTTHTQLSHTVRAERHAGTFQISRHFRHQDDIVIQL